jgi:CheY-like chemotaxis protein
VSAERILVVDDEPAVLRALTVALEAHGYEVVPAATGEAAVARAADSAPRVIILDLGLPGMDGLEVIRRVRAFLATTPIVVLSAWGDDAVKVESLDLGADDYVAKPFAMPELLARWPSRSPCPSSWRGCGSPCATPTAATARRPSRPCCTAATSRSTSLPGGCACGARRSR